MNLKLTLVISVAFLFGCTAVHNQDELHSKNELPPIEDDAEMLKLISKFNAGKEAYGISCASCHQPVDTSEKRNATVGSINKGIASVGSMGFLSSLEADKIEYISLALDDAVKQRIEDYLRDKGGVDPPTPEPKVNQLTDLRPVIGNRNYLASLLEDIFVAPLDSRIQADTNILNRIRTLVFNQTAALGGPCSRYDAACPGTIATNREAEVLPLPNALRKGYMIRACEEILAINRAVDNVMAKVELQMAAAGDRQNFSKIYDLFYPGRSAPVDVVDTLVAIHSDAKGKGLVNRDAWRFSFLAMCKSSQFEVL